MKQALRPVLTMVLAVLMSLWLVGCGGSKDDAPDATGSDSDVSQLLGSPEEATPGGGEDFLDEDEGQQPRGACPNATHWSDAADLIGSEATIVGPVTSTSYRPDVEGEPTFLNIGGDYGDPGIVTVVIWGEERTHFVTPPEDDFLNESICVSGLMSEYEGVPQIEVKRPGQIRLNE